MATADTVRGALVVLLAACAGMPPAPPPQAIAVEAPGAHGRPPRGDDIYEEPRGDLREECAARRQALALRVGGPSVVWLDAAPEEELAAFFQQDDFWYLSGVAIPGISLALRVDEQGRLLDEVLFLPAHDPQHESWNGTRLAPGAAAEAATGFRRTLPLEQRDALLAEWAPARVLTLGSRAAAGARGPSVDVALPAEARLDGSVLPGQLAALRLVKSPYEIECSQAAISITCAALREAFGHVRPGAFEYEPQGALEGAFLRLGAERAGFASIVGSGPNSVTLHYNANRRQMQAGELVVMDVGAKYRYYCADVTRTVPVGGRFTPRQRQVYDVVLEAQGAAAQAARPGVTMAQLDAIARKLITDRGFGPGFKHFKHGLGHWIGLDVHDVGGQVPIQPGMLFTIEPGIYIAAESLGVRIEDDYLMTETGALKLSGAVPSDPDDIEALLRS